MLNVLNELKCFSCELNTILALAWNARLEEEMDRFPELVPAKLAVWNLWFLWSQCTSIASGVLLPRIQN